MFVFLQNKNKQSIIHLLLHEKTFFLYMLTKTFGLFQLNANKLQKSSAFNFFYKIGGYIQLKIVLKNNCYSTCNHWILVTTRYLSIRCLLLRSSANTIEETAFLQLIGFLNNGFNVNAFRILLTHYTTVIFFLTLKKK